MLQPGHCQFLACWDSAPLSGIQQSPATLDCCPVEGNMRVYHSWGTTSDLSGCLHAVCLECLWELLEFLALQMEHPGFQGTGVLPAGPGSTFPGQTGCLVQLIWQCPWLLCLWGDGGPAYLQQGAEKVSLSVGPKGERLCVGAAQGHQQLCPARQPLTASVAGKSSAALLPTAGAAPASVVMATGCHTCRAAVSGTNL